MFLMVCLSFWVLGFSILELEIFPVAAENMTGVDRQQRMPQHTAATQARRGKFVVKILHLNFRFANHDHPILDAMKQSAKKFHRRTLQYHCDNLWLGEKHA